MDKESIFLRSTAKKTMDVFFTKCDEYVSDETKVVIENFLRKFPKIWSLGQGTLYAIIYYLCLYFIENDESKRTIHRYICTVTSRQFDYFRELNLYAIFSYLGIFNCGLSNEEIDEIRTATLEQQQLLQSEKEVKS